VPVVLARHGTIYWDQVKRCNVSPADLEVAMRANGCEGFGQVDLAVLETSGEITVNKRRSEGDD